MLGMKLFDARHERLDSPPDQRRSEFEYLNDTGIPRAEPIRALLETAFENFTGDRTDLRNRFRSKDNTAHISAAFELVLHEIMVRQGLKPSSPELPGGGKPDQRIILADASTAIVEARMLQSGKNVHYRTALDAIDSVKRPNVEWIVSIDDDPSEQVSRNEIISRLTRFADGLALEDLPTKFSRSAPGMDYERINPERGATRVRIYAVRKDGSDGGLGLWHEPDGEIARTEDIRRGIERKKSKYDLAEPYVVAMSSGKGYLGARHFREALYRTSRGDGKDMRGIWAKGAGSKVSGVLACYQFKPASIHAARMELYLNPNPVNPLPNNPFGCIIGDPGDSDSDSSGTPLRVLLKLPENWDSS
jgi:hypothetical protein